jgi:uncharacterized phage-associated protein
MKFDFQKALQAVGVLLSFERAGRMNYMRLLKLLYIADREALAETAHSITGDRPLATERGPVLSQVYDLIRGRASQAGTWAHNVHRDHYEVELRHDPGRERLSKYAVEKLRAVWERYRDLDEWDLVELTRTFGEWVANYPGGKGSAPIPLEALLQAQGKPEMVEAVRREQAARDIFDAAFAGDA